MDADAYLGYRLALLPNVYVCSWVRVSTVPSPPFRFLSKVAPVGRSGLISNTASPTAQTTCTLPVLFTAIVNQAAVAAGPGGVPPAILAGQHAHRRKFHMHGIPQENITGNVFTPTAEFRNSLNAFLRMLTRRAAGAVAVTPYRIRYGTGEFAVLASITLLPGARSFTLPNPGDRLRRGMRVAIKGSTLPRGLNRTWTVLSTDDVLHTATLGFSRRTLGGDLAGNVLFRIDVPAFAPLTNAVISPTMGSRRVSNRPFKLVAGSSRGGR